MDVTKGISHLSHIEDLVISHGVSGINTALDTLSKLVQHLEGQTEDPEDGRGKVSIAEKFDGKMSLYFGKDEQGRFFVSTKSILSQNQKVGYTLADIQQQWKTGAEDVLMCAWKALKPFVKPSATVYQCDLLWCNQSEKKMIDHEGQKFLTFKPNTILYAVPIDNKSDVYKEVKSAQIGLVMHGVYKSSTDATGRITLDRLGESQVRSATKELNQNKSLFVIDPFIDNIDAFEGSDDIIAEIKDLIDATESISSEIDSLFDDEWSAADNPMIREVKKMLPKFVNQQVRSAGEAESIITAKNEDAFLKTFKKKLKEFLSAQSVKEQNKLKSSKGKERKSEQYKELQKWLDSMDSTFEPMLRSFFRLFSMKALLFKIFNTVEKKLGKTFVIDKKNDFELIATKPEGYVLLNGPNMVKIVDRAEFSKNNFLYSPFNEAKQYDTTGDCESIGDKNPIKVKKTLSDEILEDVLDALNTTQDVTGFNEVEAVDRISQTKNYNVLWVGKMQPPSQAHMKVLAQLSSMFNKVMLLITGTGKYFDPQLSLELIQSALDKTDLRNVDVRLGNPSDSKMVFGISSKNPEVAKGSFGDVVRKFDLSSEELSKPLVLAQGQEEIGKDGEDARYNAVKQLDTLFVVNDDEAPTEEKPYGLYGIPVLRKDGQKIGARQIREMIRQNDLEEAKLAMASGSDAIKDEIIDDLVVKSTQEESIDIAGLSVDKEIINEISQEYFIEPIEAMDMILDILTGE